MSYTVVCENPSAGSAADVQAEALQWSWAWTGSLAVRLALDTKVGNVTQKPVKQVRLERNVRESGISLAPVRHGVRPGRQHDRRLLECCPPQLACCRRPASLSGSNAACGPTIDFFLPGWP